MKWSAFKSDISTTFGGAVSGGLDSCTTTHWLCSKGIDVKCFTVDLGQPDEENIEVISNRMISCGASEAVIIPGQEPLAEAGLKVIQSQAKYEGGYWNTTGIARPIFVGQRTQVWEVKIYKSETDFNNKNLCCISRMTALRIDRG